MREYALISPHFWTGQTGKFIRKLSQTTPEGHLHRSIASYLFSSPTSNMIGLYYLPLPTLCHEVGCSPKGALKVLRRLSEGVFCEYDEETEMVWVIEMPEHQLHLNGQPLKETDNRVKSINKLYQTLPNNPFLKPFFEKWGKMLHLENPRNYQNHESPSEAPSMPLRSQDQDQDNKIYIVEDFGPESIQFQLAQFFLDRIRQNAPDFKGPNDLKQWCRDIDLMIRRDKQDPEEIRKVIEWCQADNIPNEKGFCWAPNILSVRKLRKQFDQLKMRMKKPKNWRDEIYPI